MASQSADDLNVTVAALQAQLASLQAQLAAVGSATPQTSRAQPQVQPLVSAANVPLLTKFEDIQQHNDNPVQRGHQAPPTISLLDLSLEPGMVRAGVAGPAIKKEYEVVAPVLSYLWDIKAALQQQCSSSDIQDARMQSLAVLVSALDQVVQFLLERRDLLIAKGEFKSDPCLVKAVEMSLNGTDGCLYPAAACSNY